MTKSRLILVFTFVVAMLFLMDAENRQAEAAYWDEIYVAVSPKAATPVNTDGGVTEDEYWQDAYVAISPKMKVAINTDGGVTSDIYWTETFILVSPLIS